MESQPISFRPIGHVENGLPLGTPKVQLEAAESRIHLQEEFRPCLTGLEHQSQILVLFHFHASTDWEPLQHPRGDTSRPKRGVFALRSPRRPNGIGVTVVDLLKVDGTVLTVRGLDAVDGTPVLDVKPAGDRHHATPGRQPPEESAG